MRCKHRCPYDVSSVDILNEAEPRVSLLGQRRCMDCGEVVPYGPSNDEPEAVAIEVRAAQIIADGFMLWTEALAFDCEDDAEPTGPREHHPSWHAGYLARCITNHQDPTE